MEKVSKHDQLLRIIHMCGACIGVCDSCVGQLVNYGRMYEDYPQKAELHKAVDQLREMAKRLGAEAYKIDEEAKSEDAISDALVEPLEKEGGACRRR